METDSPGGLLVAATCEIDSFIVSSNILKSETWLQGLAVSMGLTVIRR